LQNKSSCRPAEATRKIAQFARKRAESLKKLSVIDTALIKAHQLKCRKGTSTGTNMQIK
jgi:hypothetical protein